jgi:UDP-N-acetylmuramate--alanine ligase
MQRAIQNAKLTSLLRKKKGQIKIHFIGIGGIGTSALAQYYLKKGAEISGSDLASSEITEMLKKKGAKIIINAKFKSQNAKLQPKIQNLIKKTDLVIYSQAVPKNHPELRLAREFKVKCLSYPQALGELTKKYFTIAVCGTHGKSTTTAMISLILIKAGLNPTVILGTKLKEFGDSNFRMGGKPSKNLKLKIKDEKLTKGILVIEADEWHESFLNYWPNIIVLTNIEREHLDYYKNLKNLLGAFKKFIQCLPKNGFLIANKDDKNISNLKSQISKSHLKIQNFGIRQKEAKKLKNILKVPGKHNIYNALAALTCARVLGIPDKISFETLSEYKGAWRRLEERKIKIKGKKAILISDYAHHPTEIKITIEAIKEKYPKKKIWLIFQPHQYQRTHYLFKDFVEVLSKTKVERIIIPPIFEVAGREIKGIKKRVSSQKLVEAINKKSKKEKAIFLSNFKEIKSYIFSQYQGDIIVIMGAGDIYKLFFEFST